MQSIWDVHVWKSLNAVTAGTTGAALEMMNTDLLAPCYCIAPYPNPNPRLLQANLDVDPWLRCSVRCRSWLARMSLGLGLG